MDAPRRRVAGRLRGAAPGCALLLACGAARPPPPFSEPAAPGSLAVVGDLQETLWLERLLLRERDLGASPRLLEDLAREKPGLLVLLGDVVAVGASEADWGRFDALLGPVRAAGIPGLAVLGNHEYWGSAGALRSAAARFPQLGQRRWYARSYGALGLVFLDSNRSELSDDDWAAQGRFLAKALRAMDGDARVKGILVFDHHPPFTNSAVTSDEDCAQAFVAPFLAARKALAFVSGHAHAYERLVEGGRPFLVSGGGGGPRVRLLSGAARRHPDLFDGDSPRPFHYLLFEPAAAGVEVTVRGFDGGDAPLRVVDRFRLPYVN